MYRIVNTYQVLIFLCLLSLGCPDPNKPDDNAGGGITIPNPAIIGKVVYPDGTPASGAAVFIRPAFSYAPIEITMSKQPLYTNSDNLDKFTDNEGEFLLSNVAYGAYLIEIRDTLANGVAIAVDVKKTDITITLQPAIMKPVGAITGKLEYPDSSSGDDSLYVSIRGLWKNDWADTIGTFLIVSIPEGTYTLRFEAPLINAQKYVNIIERDHIKVISGDTTDIGVVRLPARSASSTDSNYIRDAQVVRAILDSNGVSDPVEDFTAVLNNRIVSFFDFNGKIQKLSSSISLLPHLGILILHGGVINDFPQELGSLPLLLRLDLENHKLDSLPEQIKNLTSLVQLSIAGNNFDTVPDLVYNLKSLRFLYLRDNQIQELSDSIKNLTFLNTLNIKDNKISTLPVEIMDLSYLENFYFSNNMLCSVTIEMGKWLRQFDADWETTQQCGN